ncbi:HflC protein [hydrothermal vent metagenome]|uniref:HflC protein n=1 Tax=hydrothermal vent metagenome TaxID=652676 RepID=A0A3B0S3S9_9ZZZZ
MGFIKSFGLFILAGIAFVAFSSIFVVDEREKVLLTRFGEIQEVYDKPGLYFKTPFVEETVSVEDRLLFIQSNDKSVQVVDGRRYRVDTITVLRVADAVKFREVVGASLAEARVRVATRIESALTQTYGRRTFTAALSKDRAAMMTEIRDLVRPAAISLGLEIVDVRIRKTDLMQDVLKQTYERMNAERFAEAAQLRAVGRTRGITIRAGADREKVELVANARRESEIIKGDGDATRNKVFAEAFNRDPEFFAFYRSMQAYRTSLGSSGTTMVLSPDSEFFEFFSGATPKKPK